MLSFAVLFTLGLGAGGAQAELAPRVHFDVAHHNAFHRDDMSAFLDLLDANGFQLSFPDQRWRLGSFDSVDVLIVAGPMALPRQALVQKGFEHYWWSDEGRQDAFTSDEVAALVAWVRKGGSLLLILDHAPGASAARRLCEALGVDARNSMTWDGGRRPPGYAYPETDHRRASFILFSREYRSLGDHPILVGVERVATYVGSSLAGPLESTPLLLLSDDAIDYWQDPPERGGGEHRISAAGRAQAIALELGAGRVVIVAEYTVFQENRGAYLDPEGLGKGMAYAGADDARFALNIVRWLARQVPANANSGYLPPQVRSRPTLE